MAMHHSASYIIKFPIRGGQLQLVATLNNFTCNLSLVAGSSFITTPSVDLTSYLGKKIILTDGGGKTLSGWIKAAGSGETGTEMVVNGTMESGSPPSNWTALTGPPTLTQTTTAHSGSYALSIANITDGGEAYQVIGSISDGACFSFSGWQLNNVSSSRFLVEQVTDTDTYIFIPGYTSDAVYTNYTSRFTMPKKTSGFGSIVIHNQGSGLSVHLIDDVSCQKLTTPSVTGVTIVSSKAGSTYNWVSEDSGFNRNAASYTATIWQ